MDGVKDVSVVVPTKTVIVPRKRPYFVTANR